MASEKDPKREERALHAGEGDRDAGKKPPGAHLDARQDRNTAATEKTQAQPGGAAHADKPDPTRP